MLGLFTDFSSTRTAYLFFSLLAFFLYLILYILNVINVINMDKLRGIPWNLIVSPTINLIFKLSEYPIYIAFLQTFVLDVFFIITLFSCSVAAASRETQLNNSNNNLLLSVTNRGAFGSAAVNFHIYPHRKDVFPLKELFFRENLFSKRFSATAIGF